VRLGLYVKDEFFKGIRTVGSGGGAPYYSGAKGNEKGEFAGIHTGSIGASKTQYGPKGGHISKISPTTGKPIYYKKWSPGSAANAMPAQGSSGSGPPPGHALYRSHPEHVIGKTANGHDIHAFSGVNNTKHYAWDDHRDASHAHFAMTQHLMNVLRQRSGKDQDTSKLQGLIDAHAKFAQHHREEAVKDLLHGKQKARSEEDLSEKEGSKGK
jgi:hypothetical protein